MLQKPDVHTEKILDLANFIEQLPEGAFSMGAWGTYEEPRCICGWYQHINGHKDKSNWTQAADALGIDRDVAHRLFTTHHMTQHQAAKALRHLAVTGELVLA